MKKFLIWLLIMILFVLAIGMIFYLKVIPSLFEDDTITKNSGEVSYSSTSGNSTDDSGEILGDSDYSGDYSELSIEDATTEEPTTVEEPAKEDTTKSSSKTTTKDSTTKSTTNTTTTTKKDTTTTTKTTTKTVNSTSDYYIKVNRTQNTVNIYQKDSESNYTIPLKAMICSIGTSTPKAGSKYKITSYRRTWNGLKGGVYGQYAVQIVGNILFHSVPYTSKSPDSLEYWEYDKLGTKASLGCIRLTVQDAKWIYDYIPAGTYVEFYEDDNAGPFGKPTAMKISNNIENRNWDPTDFTEGNPWHESNEAKPIVSIDPVEPVAPAEPMITPETNNDTPVVSGSNDIPIYEVTLPSGNSVDETTEVTTEPIEPSPAYEVPQEPVATVEEPQETTTIIEEPQETTTIIEEPQETSAPIEETQETTEVISNEENPEVTEVQAPEENNDVEQPVEETPSVTEPIVEEKTDEVEVPVKEETPEVVEKEPIVKEYESYNAPVWEIE